MCTLKWCPMTSVEPHPADEEDLGYDWGGFGMVEGDCGCGRVGRVDGAWEG